MPSSGVSEESDSVLIDIKIFLNFKKRKRKHHDCQAMVAYTFNPSLGGGGRQISEFKASLIYSEFQDSQGYTEKPCLKNKTDKGCEDTR